MACSPPRRTSLNRVATGDGNVTFADLILDRSRREIRCGTQRVTIKATSCRLMSVLMENAGQVVSRASLFLSVWGLDFDPGTKVLEVQLSYVRSTLRLIGSEVTVHTLRGRGLRLHDQ